MLNIGPMTYGVWYIVLSLIFEQHEGRRVMHQRHTHHSKYQSRASEFSILRPSQSGR